MPSRDQSNYHALAWVQDDLQLSLSRALQGLNDFIDTPSKHSAIADCVNLLYQSNGILEMLNISGAAMLTKEMQRTACALRDKVCPNREQAQDTLVEALLLLPSYLRLLGQKIHDHPLKLINTINALRRARGDRPEELEALFHPSLTEPLPEIIAPTPNRQLPDINIATSKLAHAFQVSLLSWLRQQDVQSLKRPRGIIYFMRLSCIEEKNCLLWWTAEGLLESISAGGLPNSDDVKRTLGKLVQPISLQNEHSEADLLRIYPNTLLKKILLLLAKSQAKTPHTLLIKRFFKLDFFDQQPLIYGMKSNALEDASVAISAELRELQNLIDCIGDSESNDQEQIEGLSIQLHTLAQTLALLTETKISQQFEQQSQIVRSWLNFAAGPTEQALSDLADVVLNAYTKLSGDTDPASLSQKALNKRVLSECLNDLTLIKESFSLMAMSQDQDLAILAQSIPKMRQISGSLLMLNHQAVADLLSQIASLVEHYLNNHQILNDAQRSSLAESLAACDLFIEGLREHGDGQIALIERAHEELSQFETLEDNVDDQLDTPPETADANIKLEDDKKLPSIEQPSFAEGIDPEIAQIFLEEAEEVLTELNSLLPAWRDEATDSQLMDIRRHFHTLKGSGRMAGADAVGELAWSIENLLNHLIEEQIDYSAELAELVSEAQQQIPELLQRFAHGDLTTPSTTEAIQRKAKALVAAEQNETGQQSEPKIQQVANGISSVEAYIQAKPEPLKLTSVEAYIQANNTLQSLSSVEAYIQAKQASPTNSATDIDVASELSEEQQELLQIFIHEAEQHIEQLILLCEQQQAGWPVNKAMLQAIHSLKGCANIAGATTLGHIAAEFNEILRQLHAQQLLLEQSQIDEFGFIVNTLQQMLLRLAATNEPEEDLSTVHQHLAKLKLDIDDEADAKVMDPEQLVVVVDELQDLFSVFSQQLADRQRQPNQPASMSAIDNTLTGLKAQAESAKLPSLIELFETLAVLVDAPISGTRKATLLEKSETLFNQLIEQLILQNPLPDIEPFSKEVSAACEAEAKPSGQSDRELNYADSDADLLAAFTEEAAELLDSSAEAIKQWQSDTDATAAIAQLQRDLHTLKGGARLADIVPIADLTHQLESLLDNILSESSSASEDFFDLLQRCHDRLAEMQEQLQSRAMINPADSLIKEIDVFMNGEQPEAIAVVTQSTPAELPVIEEINPSKDSTPAQAQHAEQIRVRADLLDYLSNFAGEVSISRDRVTQQHHALHQQLNEMTDTVTRLHNQLRQLEIETETQILFRYEDEKQQLHSDFDPLELDRFSMIQQLSRGLTESVIDLNDISQSMESLVSETDAILLQQSRLNSDLQQGLMNTRLLPFQTVVSRLERIVRQTNAELAKHAVLNVDGTDLEIDRGILDKLVAPLEHILRNAIAHGIELPEQREQLGKPANGKLQLTISREGTEMLLSIADDGQGIDVNKVRQKALSMNLIQFDNMPTDTELLELILTSGFSTAETVSQLAGRGVGMDVVNNQIRELKGRLTIESTPGQGTRFEIRLPLTLSVIQALLVTSHEQQFALPLASVHAGERVTVKDVKQLLMTPKPKYLFNGEHYNFVPMSHLLGQTFSLADNPRQAMPLLLFKAGGMRLALLVDAINSNREIVVKKVGEQLARIRIINGATILGDGRVVFILDIPTLLDYARNKPFLAHHDTLAMAKDEFEQQHHTPLAMVVDDSITMRKASGNLLKRLGFEVMTARDGVEALSQLHEHKPDIILLDVEMPRMDGFEFASIVRNEHNAEHLPIVMITSRTGDKHRDRALGLGVDAYLGKPYQEEELVSTMKSLLADLYPQPEH